VRAVCGSVLLSAPVSTGAARTATLGDLIAHLEARFRPGMSWETPDGPEFLVAWGLSNLQPLWAVENARKGARWQPDQEAAA
jgi:hypothetical protein